MKVYKLFYLLLLLFCSMHEIKAQFTFETDGPLSGSFSYTAKTPGICGVIAAEGVEDKSSLKFQVSLGFQTDVQELFGKGLVNFATNGKAVGLSDLIPAPFDKIPNNLKFTFDNRDLISKATELVSDLIPEINCDFHILHCSGSVSAYAVTSLYNKPLTKRYSGDVNFKDKLEITSPVDTVIELPLEATATLVAVQTFCNPSKSKAKAGAQLSASIDGYEISIDESLILENGEFMKENSFNKKKILKFKIKKGINLLNFTINGFIYAESVVQGLSKTNALTCGSNAGAISEHSLIVKGFTGKNGDPLPSNIIIKGLITGINYVGKKTQVNCTSLDSIKIETTDPTCGNSNGAAKLLLSDTRSLSFEWDNKASTISASNLSQGSHYVIVRHTSGCYRTIPFQLKNKTKPIMVSLPSEVIKAQGDSLLLDATNEIQSSLDYLWSTKETTPFIYVKKPGVYNLLVKNSDNCTKSISVTVKDKIGYWITDKTINVDSGLFFDDGGMDKNYSPNQSNTSVICPLTKGKYIVLDFENVNILNCERQDVLKVFDGKNTFNVLDNNVTSPKKFVASNSSEGCLTVVFDTHISEFTASGWKAVISVTDTPPIGNLKKYFSCDINVTEKSDKKETSSGNAETKIYQFCPQQASKSEYTKVKFNTVRLNIGDRLSVFDGLGTSSLIKPSVSELDTFIASANSNGCLTVVFNSSTLSDYFWDAQISCSNISGTVVTPYTREPEPSNFCENAPVIDSYNSYRGSTSSKYSPQISGNLLRDYCGKIDNNSFYRFVSDGNPFELEYRLAGGNINECKGVQISILKADDECNSPNVHWDFLSCNTFESEKIEKLNVKDLKTGEEYFIMIDGAYGSTCDYLIKPITGIKGIKLSISKEDIICNPDGSYNVEFSITSSPDNKRYEIIEKYNMFEEFQITQLVNDGKNTKVNYGTYKPQRPYQILIREFQNSDNGILELKGDATCPIPACNIQSNITAVCYENSDDVSLTVELKNVTLPISIVGDSFNETISPKSSSNQNFIFKVPRSQISDAYNLTITDVNLCVVNNTIPKIDCLECPLDFELFPNPIIENSIKVRYPCDSFNLAIYNLNGQVIENNPKILSKEQNIYTIDISYLTQNTYIIQLERGGKISSKRFVKL